MELVTNAWKLLTSHKMRIVAFVWSQQVVSRSVWFPGSVCSDSRTTRWFSSGAHHAGIAA